MRRILPILALSAALGMTAGCASAPPPVSDTVQKYYDEHVKGTPTASASTAAAVVMSVLSDSHALNAGSWFRKTVEAGAVPGVQLGVFASEPEASATVLAEKLDAATALKGVVIIQAGTYDVLSAVGAEQAAANVEALIAGAIERGAKPVLALIPPSAERGPEVVGANALLSDFARANSVGVLDLTTAVATPSGQWKSGLSDDGVYANAAGAQIMADAAALQIPALVR
jgi:lysophospholipase L1-like esterase